MGKLFDRCFPDISKLVATRTYAYCDAYERTTLAKDQVSKFRRPNYESEHDRKMKSRQLIPWKKKHLREEIVRQGQRVELEFPSVLAIDERRLDRFD